MPGKQICFATFNFAPPLFFCELDRGHRGDHKATGCVKNRNWRLSWRQEQSGLKVESEGEVEVSASPSPSSSEESISEPESLLEKGHIRCAFVDKKYKGMAGELIKRQGIMFIYRTLMGEYERFFLEDFDNVCELEKELDEVTDRWLKWKTDKKNEV